METRFLLGCITEKYKMVQVVPCWRRLSRGCRALYKKTQKQRGELCQKRDKLSPKQPGSSSALRCSSQSPQAWEAEKSQRKLLDANVRAQLERAAASTGWGQGRRGNPSSVGGQGQPRALPGVPRSCQNKNWTWETAGKRLWGLSIYRDCPVPSSDQFAVSDWSRFQC